MFALVINTEEASVDACPNIDSVNTWLAGYLAAKNVPLRNWYLVEYEVLEHAPYTELTRSWGDGSADAHAEYAAVVTDIRMETA